MLEGLEIAVKQFSEIQLNNPTLRYDSEYFKKEYTEVLKQLAKNKCDKLESLSPWITQGPNPKFIEKELIPCLTGRNISKGRVNYLNADFIDEDEYLTLRRFQVKVGDTLVTLKGKGSIGKIGYVTENRKAIFSRDIGIIRPEGINSAYVNAFVLSNQGQKLIARGETGGTGQTTLTTTYLKYLPIPRFSIESKIGECIQESEVVLCESQKIYLQAETLLLETLGLKDFEPNSETVNVKRFKESFLNTGRLDAEYYQKKYEEIIEHIRSAKYDKLGNLINISKSIEPGSEAYMEEGIPFIRVSNLTKYGLSDPDIYLDKLEYVDVIRPKKDTILLSKDGTVGIAYKVPENMFAITSGAILHLNVKSNEVLPDYLTLVLNSLVVQMQSQRDAGGSILQHWKPSEIEQVEIPIIDKAIQEQIAALIQESFKLKKESEQLLDMAKRAVEVAIEEGEEVAKAFIVSRTIELSSPDLIVQIYISEQIKDIDFTEANSDFTTGNVAPVFVIQECETYMCLEWAIPAAITVVVGAFSNGFFGEMGKDAYKAFKNGLKQLAKKARDINVYLIGTKPVDQNNKQSKSFCIDCKTASGTQIRFLFDKDGSIDEWEVWIDKATALLAENYLQDNNEMQRKLDVLEAPLSSPIFWTFNIGKSEWEPYDMKKTVRLEYEERMKNDNKK